jgi:hypothetical protein
MCGGDECVQVRGAAERLAYVEMVGHRIAEIPSRRGRDGRQPQRIGAERRELVEPGRPCGPNSVGTIPETTASSIQSGWTQRIDILQFALGDAKHEGRFVSPADRVDDPQRDAVLAVPRRGGQRHSNDRPSAPATNTLGRPAAGHRLTNLWKRLIEPSLVFS